MSAALRGPGGSDGRYVGRLGGWALSRGAIGLWAILSLLVGGCAGNVATRDGPGGATRDRARLSLEEAIGQGRGTLLVVELLDGTQVTGRYQGKGAGGADEMAVRESDGRVRLLKVGEIAWIEKRHVTRRERIGELIVLGLVIGAGYGTYTILDGLGERM